MTCPICGDILGRSEKNVCSGCSLSLPVITGTACIKCGKPVYEEELCYDCKNSERSYVKGYPAFGYDELMRESIAYFKYHNRRCYGTFYASEIVKHKGRQIMDICPDVLVPVPVHRQKLAQRGYNQAAVLATELGRMLDIPVDEGIIERCVNTLPQKELSDRERENNIKKAFISTKKCVEYKKVMLVDDIYTTGATIEACTRVLNSCGVDEVYFTSICIGKGY